MNFSDQLRRRDSVHVRHDDVHEDEVKVPSRYFFALVDSIDSVFLVSSVSSSLQDGPPRKRASRGTYRKLYLTVHLGQEFGSNARACPIVFNQIHPRLPRSP